MRKKAMSFLLALCMVLSFLPMGALASDTGYAVTIDDSVLDEDNDASLTVKYTDSGAEKAVSNNDTVPASTELTITLTNSGSNEYVVIVTSGTTSTKLSLDTDGKATTTVSKTTDITVCKSKYAVTIDTSAIDESDADSVTLTVTYKDDQENSKTVNSGDEVPTGSTLTVVFTNASSNTYQIEMFGMTFKPNSTSPVQMSSGIYDKTAITVTKLYAVSWTNPTEGTISATVDGTTIKSGADVVAGKAVNFTFTATDTAKTYAYTWTGATADENDSSKATATVNEALNVSLTVTYDATVVVKGISDAAVSGATITLADSEGKEVTAEVTENENDKGTYNVSLAAGTYTVKVEADGYTTTTNGKLTVADGGENTTTITLSVSPTLTFTTIAKGTELLDYGENNGKMMPEDLGTFTVTQDETDKTNITVTGSANYITDWTEFNGTVEDEQEGHYLPIQIKGTSGATINFKNVSAGSGTDGKNIPCGEDGSLEMVLWLDGERTEGDDLYPSKILVSVEGADPAETYTIDFSGLVLLPKAAEGVTVEADTDDDGEVTGVVATATDNGSTVASVTVPAEVEDLGSMEIQVAATDATPTYGDDVKDDVKTFVTGGTKVEVKIVKTDAEGNQVEQFTSDGDTKLPAGTKITVTIDGLTAEKTYHIFGVSNGKVSYYGYKTLADGATSITFQTSHLTVFSAVEETEDNKANLSAAAASVTQETGTDLTAVPAVAAFGYYATKSEADTASTNALTAAGVTNVPDTWDNIDKTVVTLVTGLTGGTSYYAEWLIGEEVIISDSVTMEEGYSKRLVRFSFLNPSQVALDKLQSGTYTVNVYEGENKAKGATPIATSSFTLTLTATPAFNPTEVTMASANATTVDLTLTEDGAGTYKVYTKDADGAYAIASGVTAELGETEKTKLTLTFDSAPAADMELYITANDGTNLESAISNVVTVKAYKEEEENPTKTELSATNTKLSATTGEYDGTNAVTLPDVTVTVDGTKVEAANYTVAWTDSEGNAVSGTTVSAAGTYTATVTAGADSTVVSGSVELTFTVKAEDSGGEDEDTDAQKVTAAKTAIEAGTYTLAQATANTEDDVKTALATAINKVLTDAGSNITVDADNITVNNFTAATAGTEDNADGTNGSFDFTVALASGDKTGGASKSNNIITATAYETEESGFTVSSTEAANGGWYDVTINGVSAGKYYIVRISDSKPNVADTKSVMFNLDSGDAADGTLTFQCKTKLYVTVWESSEDTLSVDNNNNYKVEYTAEAAE